MHRKRAQILAKLSVLLGGSLFVMMFLIGFSLYQVRESMIKERRASIKNMIESVNSFSYHNYMQAIAGLITMDEAKELSKNAIRAMRYGQGGYVFLTDLNGIMLVHPIFPEYEGKSQMSMQDGQGAYIVRDLIETAKKGGGYSFYHFKKNHRDEMTQPKLTYTQLFGPWDWVVATGIYVDDIDGAFWDQVKVWSQIVIFPFILLFVITYYLGVLIARPIFQLEKAMQNAEASTRAKSDFLANMSHEIRTPLNGSMGMMALLLGTKLTQQQREWAQIALQSSEELLNLINDILDISKVESGHMILENLPFDLQANIKPATDLLYPRAHRKGVEIIVAFQPSLPSMVVGDPVRLRQIILNLVGNAIKFTQQGYILISVEGEIDREEVALKFEIKDTGIGIPEDKLAYIFEKFSQAEESTTRNFGGTGLGLAICRNLTKLMRGDVGVRSTLGQGSTFWFTVRFKKHEDSPKQTDRFITERGKRVLVSHPHAMIRRLLCDELATQGLICDVVDEAVGLQATLQEALSRSLSYHFAIVDMDYFGEDPLGVTSKIDALGNISTNTDLILVAAPDRPITTDEVVLKRSVGIVTKPVFPEELLNVMDKISYERGSNRPPSFIMACQNQSGWTPSTTPTETLLTSTQEAVSILIAEDQLINQMLMRTLITQLKCKVEVASNGLEAVRAAAENTYDLIFMDCHMPEMDGFEATKQIRELEERINRHTPIVALTADAMVGNRDKCLAAGMDEYLHKPVKAASIKEMIRKYTPLPTGESSTAG